MRLVVSLLICLSFAGIVEAVPKDKRLMREYIQARRRAAALRADARSPFLPPVRDKRVLSNMMNDPRMFRTAVAQIPKCVRGRQTCSTLPEELRSAEEEVRQFHVMLGLLSGTNEILIDKEEK